MSGVSKAGKVIGAAWRHASIPGQTVGAAAARAGESAWEEKLRTLRLSEGAALAEIERRTPAGSELRRFVLRAFRQRYVPEAVLAALRLGGLSQLAAEGFHAREQHLGKG
ncbi:MAG TPA: hypothetical protein VGR47_05875 [Terracidiphilus sp.]|nr:hypothetical protein [Terracidiphilus sp.]